MARVALWVSFAIVAASTAAAATEEFSHTNELAAASRQWTAFVRWENDIFAGEDRYYTAGFALGVSHTGPSWMDTLADSLPWGEGRRTVGYDLTQGIFNPEKQGLSIPDPDDRPYAGTLVFGLSLHLERSNSYHGLRFSAGVVGPWALAEESQREVHNLLGDSHSEGWDYQLKNEGVLNLAYEYRRRFSLFGRRDGWSLEGLPKIGAMAGNLITQGQAGGLLRFGYNIPDDFGVTLARGMGQMPPPRRNTAAERGSDWGYVLHVGATASAVLRDITLDGNTFEDSREVDKRVFVPSGEVGLSIGNRRFLASLTYVFLGEEFEGQHGNAQYGSLSWSYFF